MQLQTFDVRLDVEVEVRDERMAESADEAGRHSADTVEEAIKRALQEELSGGESRVDVNMGPVRNMDADDSLAGSGSGDSNE